MSLLPRVANVADAFFHKHVKTKQRPYDPSIDDGFLIHIPTGSLAANGFGLHDVVGNVWEWCQDWRDREGCCDLPFEKGSGLRRVPAHRALFHASRGGSFRNQAAHARSASRGWAEPNVRAVGMGCRPARAIER